MNIIGTSSQRKGGSNNNLEMLLMLLLGLICGTYLSQLMQRARLQFFDDVTSQQDSSSQSSSLSLSISNSNSNSSVTAHLNNNATRILCLVVASSLHSHAAHIERTWGRRCNKLLFMGSQRDKKLNIKERHTNSWAKTRYQLQHVYQHYYEDYDWFLKVPDNTYVIMENLQHFLQAYTPETPIYFGSNDWEQMKRGYVSGAVGYVFSKAALHRFMNLGHGNGNLCSNRNYGIEHVEIARCLRNAGVVAGNSRDEDGLSRFLPVPPYAQQNLNNKSHSFFSNTAIAFHYSNFRDFYMIEYVIYKLRPFGLMQIIPEKRTTASLDYNQNK
ncbi:glycoprotein-N-acetylgalactosamine 3-beta-galactosyltransferase 1 [Drosophila innubila]|uniref:glycoprotein-N-acetylgalactosamine 3-beta-galactosyltransferase 1 n=1 Tax=Drosophila innubila TaxID=198719 RepID=UPI00148B3A3F|nr:glycoprotein-N-acetylgalactosamine 3-beta-galactosyltransferase 1 [Drosophila innubila]